MKQQESSVSDLVSKFEAAALENGKHASPAPKNAFQKKCISEPTPALPGGSNFFVANDFYPEVDKDLTETSFTYECESLVSERNAFDDVNVCDLSDECAPSEYPTETQAEEKSVTHGSVSELFDPTKMLLDWDCQMSVVKYRNAKERKDPINTGSTTSLKDRMKAFSR